MPDKLVTAYQRAVAGKFVPSRYTPTRCDNSSRRTTLPPNNWIKPAIVTITAFGISDFRIEAVEGKSQEPMSDAFARDQSTRELTHEETLEWIDKNRAWRRARKTQPMWARPVTAEEIGKEFQTADRAVEKAREGAWLCVGIANEPWFQSPEKIKNKYEQGEAETTQFAFDNKPREYHIFLPKRDVVNWAARVDGPGIAGFSIRPGYDPDILLHSPAGGYVVRGDVPDPYQNKPDDAWLVQQPLFESTYELMEE